MIVFSESFMEQSEGFTKLPVETRQNESAFKPNQEAPRVEVDQTVIARGEAGARSEIRRFIAGILNNNPSTLPNLGQSILARPKVSALEKVGNIFRDQRLSTITRPIVESLGVAVGLDVIAVGLGLSQVADVAIPLATAYAIGRLVNLTNRAGLNLGEQLTLWRQSSLLTHQTPVGLVEFGEQVGSLHLVRLGKIAKMPSRDRMVRLPLEGLRGLEELRKKIAQKDPRVVGMRIFEATSHLVAQNPDLFEKLGFKLEPAKSSNLRAFLTTLSSKAVLMPIFGFVQLFQGRGLRGFYEANSIRIGNARTAWITPEDLVSHGQELQAEIQRFQRVADKLGFSKN